MFEKGDEYLRKIDIKDKKLEGYSCAKIRDEFKICIQMKLLEFIKNIVL